MDKRLIAVTGATGFLGGHLVERLLADGFRLSVLARDPDKAEPLRDRVERLVIGDVADETAAAELVEGADAVLHLVSNFRTASGPPGSYRRVNVDGTKTVLAAAERAGVRRFINCSTIGVHGDVESSPANEEAPFNPGDEYQRTKLEAELHCREHARRPEHPTEIVVLRPASMYGPGDRRMLKLFRGLGKGTFPMIGPGRENFHAVYVDDVVAGFMLALDTPGIDGEVFLLPGPDYLPLRDYVAEVARAVGAGPPRIRLPYAPVYALGAVCERICVPLGIEPPLHRRRVRFYRNNRAFTHEKARRLLGYEPTVPLAEGLRRTVAWYREQGLLPDAGSR